MLGVKRGGGALIGGGALNGEITVDIFGAKINEKPTPCLNQVSLN